MLCMHNTTILCQFGLFVTSLPTHISINSHPFLVGIVSKIMKRMIANQEQKGLKKSQKMSLKVGLRKSRQRNPHQSPADKKDYQAIFRKCISVGEDGGEDYDVTDIQIEAQKAVRRITDHLEIVKQYLKW